MYERMDTFIGTIVGTNAKGCYVETGGEENARGYYYGPGKTGDRVMCSVKRVDPYSYLLKLDSVLYYAPLYSHSKIA